MEKATVDEIKTDVESQYDSSSWVKSPDDDLAALRKKCFNRYVYGDEIKLRDLYKLYDITWSRIRIWSSQDSYVESRKRLNKSGLMKGTDPIEHDQLKRCRELFIESYDTVELTFLADISGYSPEYLQKIRDKEQWDLLRRSFQSDLRSEVRKVKIKKYAEMVSERNRKAVQKQLDAYQAVEDISNIFIENHQEKVMKAYREGGDVEKAIRRMGTSDLKRIVEILDRSLEAQRKLLGLDYFANHTAAVSLLLSEGYAVRPRDYIIKLEAKYNISSDDQNVDALDVMNASMLAEQGIGDEIIDAEELPGTVD